jgi:hypothetical protein
MQFIFVALLVMFGVATPWKPAGVGIWEASLNDPQVSIARIKLAGNKVIFSVAQKCAGERATETMTTLEWTAGEKFGERIACDGTKYRSNQPEALEPSFRKSDLPTEVQKKLGPKPEARLPRQPPVEETETLPWLREKPRQI